MSRLEAFSDMEEMLNRCIHTEGGVVTLATRGAAIRWRQRAYHFRKIYREHMQPIFEASSDPEQRIKAGTTPWDSFVLGIDPAEPTKVIVRIGQIPVLDFTPGVPK